MRVVSSVKRASCSVTPMPAPLHSGGQRGWYTISLARPRTPPQGVAMSKLAVVIGDPTGIGPEVLARTLAAQPPEDDLLLVGDAQVWEQAQRIAGVTLPPRNATPPG